MTTQKSYEPVTPHKVAFLGLGVMGFPMAGHLARAGHHVAVYNRTMKKAERWADEYDPKNEPAKKTARRKK
jgi:3-hydroxyisobutyrate dehydrogenase-like beta-hydroxyacid dehydrogenase